MPLISVIVPVYNGEKTIQKTIESVSNQSFQDLEILVINDGSQDSTLKILEQIPEPRLQVFSYPNAGVAASRNRGISRATGEFIALLDADDLWTADKLESQFKALQNNPNAAVAYSWSDFIDEQDQFLHPGSHVTVNGDAYAKILVNNFLENGSNPLIRTQALIEVGKFEESLPPADEWDIWIRLAARYQFVAVPTPQVLYRVSVGSQSYDKLSQLESACLQVIERGFNQAPQSLQHLKRSSLANLYQYLTFKAIQGTLIRKRAIVACRYLWYALRNDPVLLKRRTKLISIVSIKIMIAMILPEPIAQKFYCRLKNL